MGNTIVVDAAPAASDYDQWEISRATTISGSYSVLETQALTDLTYYDEDGTSTSWYKVRYKNSSNSAFSAFSTPIQGQSTTYTTPKKIQSFLQLDTLSDTSNPSIQEIIELINEKEDEIDFVTNHAWRLRYSKTASGDDKVAKYYYMDVANFYKYQTGVPIYLPHREIRGMDSDLGDALEFFDGSNWTDWLSTKTEGRANDFWFDYPMGVLFVRSYWNIRRAMGLRIKYRHGETIVNQQIAGICKKMVAIDVLAGMNSRAVILQEGSAAMNHSQKIELWTKQIEDKLQRHKELRLPATNQ